MSQANDPNKLLGTEIFEALAEQGLIDKTKSARLLNQLIDGSVKSSDWKLAIETVIRDTQNATDNETAQSGN